MKVGQITSTELLPAGNIRLPFSVISQVPPNDIGRISRRFFWLMRQNHARLLEFAPAFAMITGWASRHNIRPDMLSAKITRHNMIHRQATVTLAAVLARERSFGRIKRHAAAAIGANESARAEWLGGFVERQ